jgi:hypothetical protein
MHMVRKDSTLKIIRQPLYHQDINKGINDSLPGDHFCYKTEICHASITLLTALHAISLGFP